MKNHRLMITLYSICLVLIFFNRAGIRLGTGNAKERPRVAITFDDGPEGQITERLLNGLRDRNVRATFFVVGEKVDMYPQIVKRQFEEGHVIGNHTYSHVQLTQISLREGQREITKTDRAVARITGSPTEYIRPPFGAWSDRLEENIDAMSVFWTVDPLDWRTGNADKVVNKVVTEVKENDIILLHDCYESSVEAALEIIDILKDRGFVFVTVDDILMD